MQKNKNRPGYKKTKVGWIPMDWDCTRLGKVFEKRNARGSDGVPIFSVSQEHGLVPRESLDRRVETNLSSTDSLLVEPGDIAYNMMRMWQGAVDVCRETCVVSPAYVVCRPIHDRVTSDFMLLYFKDFALVPAPLPSLPEQEAIAEVLECWDKVIRGYERKIEKKRNIKKGLMQRLLSGKQRLPGFDGEWKEVRLRNLLSYERPDKYIVQDTDYLEHGDTPVLTANKSFILGYTSETFGVCQDIPAIVFDDFTTSIQFADFPFKVKSSAIKLLRPLGEDVDIRFVFERMQLLHFSVGEHKRYYISEYQHCRVAVPKIREQQAIAAVLSSADAEISVLDRKLAALREQKRFLLNNMVTGTIRLPQFVNTDAVNVTTGDTE